MNSKNFVPILSLILVVIITALIFYYLVITSSSGRGYFYDGILAVIFALISYFLHSVINAKNVITSFSYGYYILSIGYFAYYVMRYNFAILNIVLILLYVLVSLPFIYWRQRVTSK